MYYIQDCGKVLGSKMTDKANNQIINQRIDVNVVMRVCNVPDVRTSTRS